MILEYLQMVVDLTNLNDPLKKWRISSKKFVKLKCFSGFTCRVGTKFISRNHMSWRAFQSTKWGSVYMRIVTFMVTIHFWRDVIQMYWWRSRHSDFLFCKIFREINFVWRYFDGIFRNLTKILVAKHLSCYIGCRWGSWVKTGIVNTMKPQFFFEFMLSNWKIV